MWLAVRLWLLSVLIAGDRLINAILLGSCDETLSSRAYRAWMQNRYPGKLLKPLIDLLFRPLGQKAHCYNAWRYESMRFQPGILTDTAGIALSETLRKV